jgi:hypothetical protein
MASFKMMNNVAGWLVFAVAALVLGAAAEPTGSLVGLWRIYLRRL